MTQTRLRTSRLFGSLTGLKLGLLPEPLQRLSHLRSARPVETLSPSTVSTLFGSSVSTDQCSIEASPSRSGLTAATQLPQFRFVLYWCFVIATSPKSALASNCDYTDSRSIPVVREGWRMRKPLPKQSTEAKPFLFINGIDLSMPQPEVFWRKFDSKDLIRSKVFKKNDGRYFFWASPRAYVLSFF